MTTNHINGKRYIGKRSKPEFDINYLGSGKLLKRAIKKYGKENFSCKVLEWCSTRDDLNAAEKQYIKLYNAQRDSSFYNISSGGDWGNVTDGMSKAEYEGWKKKINPTGRHHSDETKRKISQSRIGIKFSPETIEKMRQNNLGEKNNMYGKHISQERKDAMSKKFSKPVSATLPNGQTLEFRSVKCCREYFQNNYKISGFVIKKLLRTQLPLTLPEREKNHYPHVYQMNGLTVKYKECDS